MKRLWILPLALMLTALGLNPARADGDAALASELSNLRDAWLHGDDATAAARLDVMRTDDRLTGELPRWYAFLRASLALKRGDSDKGWEVIEPVLQDSPDARNYIRAARLLLTYGETALAEKAIDAGLERKDDSPGLLRFKAGLQWLGGKHEAAIDSYMKLLLNDDRQNYPYVTGYSRRWSELPPWEDAVDEDEKNVEKEDYVDTPTPEEGEEVPEPHVSLFLPVMWYTTDLPGLDRCVLSMSEDTAIVELRHARHADLIKKATEAQSEFDNYRGGEVEKREELQQNAKRAAWEAVLNARIVAQAKLNAGDYEAAEKLAQEGLSIDYDDVALLDILAQVYGKQGKAEEARSGALASLALVAGLGLDSMQLVRIGPSNQKADRIFEPALTLMKANPEAGLKQFEELRKQFSNDRSPIFPGVLGMWLYLRGETELARKYLLESSRFSGHDSGKSLSGTALLGEFGLLAIGEGEPAGEEEPDKPAPPPNGNEEEVDPVEMAKVGNAHPLLRKSLRVGGVMGSTHPTVEKLRQLADIDLWGGSAGIAYFPMLARVLPEGDQLVFDTLYAMPGQIVKDVKPAELEAFIAPEHNATTTLQQALESLGDSCEQYRSSSNWRLRRTIQEKSGPVFGMVEARAILLRAQLRHDKPQNLEELTAWLEKYQPQIDIRSYLQKSPDERYVRASKAREEAGVPEIVHYGLLLDAGVELARAGKPGVAAKLIWHNRDNHTGMETPEHLLWLASVFARKAGDAGLATRCRIEGASRASELPDRADRDPARHLIELPLTRENLLEFGTVDDLLNYVENVIVPVSSADTMDKLNERVPEMKEARPTLVMRNPGYMGIDGIFAASIEGASCVVIQTNWDKLLFADENLPACHRFAAWVISSDLPLTYQRGGFNGCNSAADTVSAWQMLRELYEREGNEEQAARLAALLESTATESIEEIDFGYDYWD